MFDTKDLYDLWKGQNILNQLIDSIGFTEIYVSPVTIALLALFFINLLVVTLNRVPVMLKRAYLMGELPSFKLAEIKRGRNQTTVELDSKDETVIKKLHAFFRKKKWFFRETQNINTFIAIKNRYSPIGFLLFHLSFFLCLIGGLMITYTRFSGNLPLTEGQSFHGDITQFRAITSHPKILKRLATLDLSLEKVQPSYENEVPTELVASLQVTHNEKTVREVIRINEPVNRGNMSIIAEKIGVSPLFIVRGPGGRQIDAVYVSLNVLGGAEDSFRFDTDKRFTFIVKFFPDYVKENGYETTRSIELNNPAIHLVIGKESGVMYEGTIKKGERAAFGAFTISFEDIRYWVEFLIVREYGKFPLMTGFIMAAIGLIMRLVFYQKRLSMAIEYENDKPLLYIDGKSEYFRYSFEDEMNTLVNELEGFLGREK